jgi:lipopolysaccharide transport system ATP-binding protein
MSSEIVVRVSGLAKNYHIYPTPRDRLKQFILPRVRRLFRLPPRNYFHEFKALENVDFEVRRGETFGIVGRNGSGKSTLLQILCGTLAPSAGLVEINGRVAALLELGAGFNPEFTGRENVYMNARVLGLSQEQIETRFAAIAAFADIGEFIERPVKTYSSGMYVRLAFAVIAHVDADILIIDEALSVGDAYFVQKCMRYLRTFMERGTLLFVSHDSGSVLNLCTRAMLLENGHVRCLDTPKIVVQRYLAALVESNQGAVIVQPEPAAHEKVNSESNDFRDMRQDLLNASALRNDIEVFRFNQESSAFGTGLASILDVRLLDAQAEPLAWALGGESVSLRIRCEAKTSIASPIVGFQLLDRLGQTLFGDNTYLSHRGRAPWLKGGETIEAIFEFRMPLLPPGDYSLCVAVADGTQESHIQHHWMHDALMIRVHSNSGIHGLVGVPMHRIELRAA